MTRALDFNPQVYFGRANATLLLAILAAALMLFTGAEARPAPHGGGYAHRAGPARGGDYRGYRGGGGWGGGFERAPPVVFGSPYYAPYAGYPYASYPYPPPLIYGPGIGISVPGIVIGGY
jgi:hypothetical protein